jgi:3',5'-cyclic AMP phosphodiesterase CpdA
MKRRSLLQLAAGSAGLFTPLVRAVDAAAAKPFRFLFATDIHVQPERGGIDGWKQCVAKMNQVASATETKSDFLITGGDLIMDALEVGIERSRLEWTLFDEGLKGLGLPAHHTIGNHDVVGWSSKAVVDPGHQDYGKKLFADRYGEGKTYRSFDHGGWHFVLLDSIGRNMATGDYEGRIDDDQLAWLEADLAKTGKTTPVVIVTHIPFYSVWHQVIKGPAYALDGKALVANVFEFRKLLEAHNVKLVLSGHGHVLETIELGRTRYIQGGAVCGMWWKGPVYGNPEGFGIVECRPDGTFSYRYKSFDWTVRA